jgi:predicted naringenin-chalcone synthase
MDNIASSLLFGDGAAAVLITSDEAFNTGIVIDSFYSEVVLKGKRDMAWELSSTGFLMTLSGYIPDLIEEDFRPVLQRALDKKGWSIDDIDGWCIHPGGKRVLSAIQKSLGIKEEQLISSYEVLKQTGNLSSATILFVLKRLMDRKQNFKAMAGAAFGPGLTVETFLAHS